MTWLSVDWVLEKNKEIENEINGLKKKYPFSDYFQKRYVRQSRAWREAVEKAKKEKEAEK